MEDDPFEDSSSKNTGNTIGSGAGAGGAGKTQPDPGAALRRFKKALKEDNLALRACKIHLEEAIQVIESLQKEKISLPKPSLLGHKDENSSIAKILQEIKSIKATISQSQALTRPPGQSWARVASKPEAPGTIIRIQDEEEKKAIAKLSSEELVKKLDTKEVIGAKQMTNGQVRIFFAGQEIKEMMETRREWTTKLAPTAQIASKSYQVLAHDMPLSFDPSNEGHIKELEQANSLYLQGITIQRAAWLKKTPRPGKTAGSLILWFQQAEHADRAINKGIMWRFELRATELFRSGFRAMQCFNCQRYGHIAKMCTAEAKCGKCAGEHNTRECSGKQEVRCSNCGKKHTSWDQSCPVRLAAKSKAMMNRTQDPGSYQQQETQPRNTDCEWQIVGSRKRRAGMAGPQVVGADGEIIERRGPGRPKGSTNKIPNLTRAATMAPSIPSMPKSTTPETSRTVTRENPTEINGAPDCVMES
ncbi:hypothetical protein K3495_g7139 [Podosphaera aphanis]|nr:hypothetical protein K3495_g7139 [Podosphaera aphanis]